METLLDETEKEVTLTDREIFTMIWTSPRMVFKYINDNHYDKYVTLLLVLGGISGAFERASRNSMGDKSSILTIVLSCILIGGLLGWISYYLYAALVSWTGKWLKGQGNTKSILRILAYAMIPYNIALIFLIPQIAIYGNQVFQSDFIATGDLASRVIFYGCIFFEVLLGICSIVFSVIGTSEVQKLSIGKSILNLILPAFVIVVPIALLILAFT